jgi:hypothetical protein
MYAPSLADARSSPFGEKRTTLTVFWWECSFSIGAMPSFTAVVGAPAADADAVAPHAALPIVQRRTSLSAPAVARSPPLG